MLIAILLMIGGVMGVGVALGIYYEIKHDTERKERDAEEAKARATRKIFL